MRDLTRRHLFKIVGAGGLCLLSPISWAAIGEAGEADEADEVTALFNKIRREHGLSAMIADKKLESVAKNQAQLMAKKGRLSHSVGWGNGFKSRLHKARVRGDAAENIAAGQSDFRAVFAAWMRSSNHRRNMLDPVFSRYGLAYAAAATRPNYLYWTIVLGR